MDKQTRTILTLLLTVEKDRIEADISQAEKDLAKVDRKREVLLKKLAVAGAGICGILGVPFKETT